MYIYIYIYIYIDIDTYIYNMEQAVGRWEGLGEVGWRMDLGSISFISGLRGVSLLFAVL